MDIKQVKTHEPVFIKLGTSGGNNLGKDISPAKFPNIKMKFAGEFPELGSAAGVVVSIGNDAVYIPDPNIVSIQFQLTGEPEVALVPHGTRPVAIPKHPKESKAGKDA